MTTLRTKQSTLLRKKRNHSNDTRSMFLAQSLHKQGSARAAATPPPPFTDTQSTRLGRWLGHTQPDHNIPLVGCQHARLFLLTTSARATTSDQRVAPCFPRFFYHVRLTTFIVYRCRRVKEKKKNSSSSIFIAKNNIYPMISQRIGNLSTKPIPTPGEIRTRNILLRRETPCSRLLWIRTNTV